MPNLKLSAAFGLSLTLAACVTVNVYFPAAAAEKAADRFIEDVYGESPAGEADKPDDTSEEQGSSIKPVEKRYVGIAATLVNVIVPLSYGQEPDITISTPAISSLRAAMKRRHAALQPYYESGAVAMTNNGLLTIRDAKLIPLKRRNEVKKLVSDENRDRDTLYPEIAKANKHPEWETQIRAIFAKRWVANAPAGWWYQDGIGSWMQK